MRTIRPRSLLVACALLAVTGGCLFPSAPDDYDFDFDFCTAPVTRVAFDVPSIALRIGDTATVDATPLDAAGTGQVLCDVEWSSSNDAVARVVGTPTLFGRGVLGVGPGSAWVRATAKGRTDSVLVTMSTVPIASVTVDVPATSLLVGQTMRLVATARDASGNVLPVRRVQWRSSAASTLQVTTRGLVVARGTGSASVEATMEGVKASAAIATSRSAPAIPFRDVSAGDSHSCAIAGGSGAGAGSAWCWGAGWTGQLGTGDIEPREFPTRVPGSVAFSRISAGNDHTCAESDAGAVYCWGGNGRGQLGDGSTTDRRAPTRVATNAVLHDVVAASGFTCALEADGVASCWGTWGRVSSRTPRRATVTTSFVDLAGGGGTVCGLSAEGAAYCWGWLGDRTLDAPTLVDGGLTFRAIDAQGYAACGIASDAQVYCWGSGSGLLWDPATGNRATPVVIPGSAGSVALALTATGLCVTKAAGDLWCLGYIAASGGAAYTLARVERGADQPFARLDGGAQHACAIDVVGGAWCWGSNIERQAGVGEEMLTQRPLQLRIP